MNVVNALSWRKSFMNDSRERNRNRRRELQRMASYPVEAGSGAIKADFGSARFRNTILISMGANYELDTYALLQTLNVGTGAN